MEKSLIEHRGEIAELCRRYRVRRLDLFGSAAFEACPAGDSRRQNVAG